MHTQGDFKGRPRLRAKRRIFAGLVALDLLACVVGFIIFLPDVSAPPVLSGFIAALALLLTSAVAVISLRGLTMQKRFAEAFYEIADMSATPVASQRELLEYLLLQLRNANRTSDDNAYYQLLQKQAELGVMQNQINPHFLYNTLECLRGLALEQGAYETADMAELLSRLYRYYISSGNDMQPIEMELLCVDRYIRIQQYRFHNRFTLMKKIDESDRSVMDYKIPKLTLQPIIENIIRHAFNAKLEDNRILIEIETTQSRLIMHIEDNGAGMDEATLDRINMRFCEPGADTSSGAEIDKGSGTGIALSNINTRIQMIYGRQYGLTAYSSLGLGTEIRIELPYEETKSE